MGPNRNPANEKEIIMKANPLPEDADASVALTEVIATVVGKTR